VSNFTQIIFYCRAPYLTQTTFYCRAPIFTPYLLLQSASFHENYLYYRAPIFTPYLLLQSASFHENYLYCRAPIFTLYLLLQSASFHENYLYCRAPMFTPYLLLQSTSFHENYLYCRAPIFTQIMFTSAPLSGGLFTESYPKRRKRVQNAGRITFTPRSSVPMVTKYKSTQWNYVDNFHSNFHSNRHRTVNITMDTNLRQLHTHRQEPTLGLVPFGLICLFVFFFQFEGHVRIFLSPW